MPAGPDLEVRMGMLNLRTLCHHFAQLDRQASHMAMREQEAGAAKNGNRLAFDLALLCALNPSAITFCEARPRAERIGESTVRHGTLLFRKHGRIGTLSLAWRRRTRAAEVNRQLTVLTARSRYV